MTARVRAPLAQLEPGDRRLDARASRYLSAALRLREGDALVAFDPDRAREADAIVVGIDKGTVILRVGPLRDAPVTAPRPITWLQGVAKGDKMDAIVRDVTELGATQFVPVLTAFSVVKLDVARGEARAARWERIAREAGRQCGRGDVPEVLAPCSWAVATRLGGPSARFCLYERAQDPLGPPLERALREPGALCFAAGPEGGLEPREVAQAEEAGWTIVSLGPIVLRTETVAAAVLGAVRILGG